MRKKIIYLDSVEQLNKVLDVVRRYTPVLYMSWEDGRKQGYSLASHSFIEDKQVNIEVTTKYYQIAVGESKQFMPTTFVFRKDGDIKVHCDPTQCYATMQRYYAAPDYSNDKTLNLKKNEKGSFVLSAGPLVGYNKKWDNREDYLYVYDLNSAYAAVMMGQIPDTSTYTLRSVVHEDEIGFLLCDGLPLVHKGYADIVFKMMDSPYKNFARKYYDIKRNSTGATKAKAKAMLVYSVGYLQRHNPFIRAYIVNSCNEFIKGLLDDDSIMWNTDAIYSKRARTDLEIGSDIGQFKLEHEGLIRHRGNCYQIVDSGEVTYRGTAKAWFSEDFNLLTDELPTEGNIWQLNRETLQMEETLYV